MRSQIEMLLERGIEEAKAGERERARRDFIRVIELHQRNQQAWLWLSKVADDPADRIVALENVLTLDPGNEQATAELRRLRRQTPSDVAERSLLPRLDEPAEESIERLCPRCGFRNPNWAYVCDRCGAELEPVDPQKALGPASRPRQPSFITVIETWLGAIAFDRAWIFVPEIELATWGRSLAALVLAALFSSTWHTLTSAVLQMLTNGCDPHISDAYLCGLQTAVLAVPLVIAWLPTALVTWLAGRAMGGEQGLKLHAHLTAIALSAWVAIGAFVAPIPTLLEEIVPGEGYAALLLEALPLFLVIALGVAGIVWLTQAIQTAQRLSATRATLITLLLTALELAALYGLNVLSDGQLVNTISGFLMLLFLPWP